MDLEEVALMEERDISPQQLRAVNAPFDREHLQSLVESMRNRGWIGRPLLIEEVYRYGFPQYIAWTGSHRIEAAKRVGLAYIPCLVITHQEADSAFSGAEYDQNGFSSWRDAVTSAEGPLDTHRLRGLERAGLAQAAHMLMQEIAAQD